jgi:hypothetical protein
MIFEMLNRALGKPKRYFKGIKNIEFNCPRCAENECIDSDNKFNLNVTLQANNQVFHCWKCSYKGPVKFLLQKYGKTSDYKAYMEYNFESLELTDTKKIVLPIILPKEFILFKDIDLTNEKHLEAYNYVTIERNINIKTINFFKVGFCVDGYYKNRIIIPSYDKYNKLNWFATRVFDNSRQSHLNPTGNKDLIIFNEYNINFNHPLYLVEGSFDMLSLPINTCVLLGKKINRVLLDKIIKYQTPIIIILDPDAENDANEIEEELKLFGIKYVKNIKGLEMDLNELKINNEKRIKEILI